MRNSCYDCHSNETHLAWFDEIVPAYWLVASDVEDGRSRLNFSEIGKLPAAQQKTALYEAVNEVLLGAMPLASYTRLHTSALMTQAQMNVLKNYLNPTRTRAAATTDDLATDEAQYEIWLRDGLSEHAVAPAPNGIQFPSGYRNWKTIGITDRFDNQTIRVILGNVTAVRAGADGRTNSWPMAQLLRRLPGSGAPTTEARFTPERSFRWSL